MAGVVWKLPGDPGSKKKAQSVEAVRIYLENKLERHDSELPSYEQLMLLYGGGGWKYAGTFNDSDRRVGYRITIRQAARVIHVHVADKLISRAHFIRKLVETDAKMLGKLNTMEQGSLTTAQQTRFGEDKYAVKRMEENLPALGAELRRLREEQAAEGRYDAIIYDSRAPGAKRFGYTAGAMTKEVLKVIRDIINLNAGDGTITGAYGLSL